MGRRRSWPRHRPRVRSKKPTSMGCTGMFAFILVVGTVVLCGGVCGRCNLSPPPATTRPTPVAAQPQEEPADWSIDYASARGGLRVVAAKAVLYEANDAASTPMATVGKGAELRHFGRDVTEEFYRSRDSGRRVYVRVEDVERTDLEAVARRSSKSAKTTESASPADAGDVEQDAGSPAGEATTLLDEDDRVVLDGVELISASDLESEAPLVPTTGTSTVSGSTSRSSTGRSSRAGCRSGCRKICRTGIACGDSCISAGKTCRKGRGSACNAREVCR